jgi:hypothetical protein
MNMTINKEIKRDTFMSGCDNAENDDNLEILLDHAGSLDYYRKLYPEEIAMHHWIYIWKAIVSLQEYRKNKKKNNSQNKTC